MGQVESLEPSTYSDTTSENAEKNQRQAELSWVKWNHLTLVPIQIPTVKMRRKNKEKPSYHVRSLDNLTLLKKNVRSLDPSTYSNTNSQILIVNAWRKNKER